eukprot:TRINITY_DN5547_c0_g1_i1.p1 TRINITY_DN5547_c0_g1~~TRINITY_DN5547_c0_g1_i1.p1  ORF type:complete len:369 (+),score=23.04 TRINITY_DN5547_c0_g1_i1:217-1323(+)
MSQQQSNQGPAPPNSYSGWNVLPPKFLLPPHLLRSHEEANNLARLMNLNLNSGNPNFINKNKLRGGATFLAPKKPRHAWKNNRRNGNGNNGNKNETQHSFRGGYEPPKLQDLQVQNRLKARKFFNKKKKNFQKPYAPRNTTSFIMRAKKEGGIASLVSPCPVTPAILTTPVIFPASEGLTDMAKEEWGVNGYGSMNGLIRLKDRDVDAEDESASSGGSESEVEEHLEVERRLDHDLSRFEMVYPSIGSDSSAWGLLDQETQLARLEEENLTLKERLFLMQREMDDLRRRLEFLECGNPKLGKDFAINSSKVSAKPDEVCVNSNNKNNASEDDDAAFSEKSVGDRDPEYEVNNEEGSVERTGETSGACT